MHLMSDEETENDIVDVREMQYQLECDRVDEEERVEAVIQAMITLEARLKEYVHRHNLPFLQYFEIKEWINASFCTTPSAPTRRT